MNQIAAPGISVRVFASLSGITELATLLGLGIETPVQVENARRLARLGGSDPKVTAAPRLRGNAA